MSDTSDFPTYEEQLEAERIREEERLAEHELHLAMREGGPRITSSSPESFVIGTVNNIEVMGSGFVDGSEIELDGSAQSTTFVDSNHLSAVGYTAPATPGTVTITVRNPDDSESNDWSCTITATA
jgi:IPT/TIG domain